ncbi:MAG: riboflavin kinase [Candidatus Paceibacterota bacterium]
MEEFNFSAKVVKGLGRGKTLGFPTANLDAVGIGLDYGVYLVEIGVGGKKYNGLLFFGKKQTFGEPVSMEVFIKEFNGDIYGETVAVRVVKKVREIKKFDNPEELQKQIARDISENFSI